MSNVSTPVVPSVPIALMTAEEFTAKYHNVHAELVKGVVKEYPGSGAKHGKVCANIGYWIAEHVHAHDLGHTMSNDSWIQTTTNPDTIRGADVCFFSHERLPRGPVPGGLLSVFPELVVEVRPPKAPWTDMYQKVAEYVIAGVRAVVVLDPASTAAAVYRADEVPQLFHNSDLLTIPELLPSFSVPVSRLFA